MARGIRRTYWWKPQKLRVPCHDSILSLGWLVEYQVLHWGPLSWQHPQLGWLVEYQVLHWPTVCLLYWNEQHRAETASFVYSTIVCLVSSKEQVVSQVL